jgi:site-specific recombinase XerD
MRGRVLSGRGLREGLERRRLDLIRLKNGNSRTIPPNASALAALQELQGGKARSGTGPVFPLRANWRFPASAPWMVPGCARRGENSGINWHCNRPAFASRLVMAGVDLRTVAELLGRGTLQMVMRYAHLSPEDQASAVDRLVPGGARMAAKSAADKSQAKGLSKPKH